MLREREVQQVFQVSVYAQYDFTKQIIYCTLQVGP